MASYNGPDCKEFNVDFEYSLLGYNIPNGRLDMLLRYGNWGTVVTSPRRINNDHGFRR